MNSKVILMAGVPGSGKTFLAKNLSEKLNCPVFTDPLSQLRYNKKHPNICCFYDYYIDNLIINHLPYFFIALGNS